MSFEICLKVFILGIIKHCFCFDILINQTLKKEFKFIYKRRIWKVSRKQHWSAEINLKPLHFKEKERNKNISVGKLDL